MKSNETKKKKKKKKKKTRKKLTFIDKMKILKKKIFVISFLFLCFCINFYYLNNSNTKYYSLNTSKKNFFLIFMIVLSILI